MSPGTSWLAAMITTGGTGALCGALNGAIAGWLPNTPPPPAHLT